MANRPPPARPVFRLGQLARQPQPQPRPAPTPTPQAQLQPPSQLRRPPIFSTPFAQAFRPEIVQPRQPPPPPPPPQPGDTTAQSAPPRPSVPSLMRSAPAPAPSEFAPPPTVTSPTTLQPITRVSELIPSKSTPISSPMQPSSSTLRRSPEKLSREIPEYSPLKPSVTAPVAARGSPSPTASPKTSRAAPLVAQPDTMASPRKPEVKPTFSPPSPFSLPPQLKSTKEPTIPSEAEPKRVLVQEIPEKPKVYPNASRGDSVIAYQKSTTDRNGNNGKSKGGELYKKSSESKGIGRSRIITIAGENKGAIMELGFSPRNNNGGWAQRGSSAQGSSYFHKSREDTTGDGIESDRSSKMEGGRTIRSQIHPPLNAYINSNVQGVNNSIMFNSTCTHHDPGIHFSLSRRRFKDNEIRFDDHASGKQV